jgi:hypothetical protein
MSKKSSIKRDYRRMTKMDRAGKAKMILSAMTGNMHFLNAIPSLSEFNAAIVKLEDAISAAQYGDRIKLMLLNTAGDELTAQMDQLADYVTLIANGDRAIMATSGLTINPEHNTNSELGTVENFKVEQGKNSGEAIANVDAVTDAKFYLFLINEGVATADMPGWEQAGGKTRRSVIIKDLKPTTLYSFYVKVYGTNDQETQSQIITRMFL